MTHLSPHFSMQELTYSQSAARAGFENTCDKPSMANLQRLAWTMEEVRTICGDHAVIVTSGYRSPPVNELCGGSKTSFHCMGLACDFIIPSFGTPLEVCRAIRPHIERLKIDQLIYEFNQWVHLGLSDGKPRHQCLTINCGGTSVGF